jgi:hypothetical protein
VPSKGRLFIDVVERDARVLVRMEGVIDEDNPLQTALPEASKKQILVHAGKVGWINSCGVRDWVRWLAALEARENDVYFVQCPPVLVGQINLVRNFGGERGQVVSFLAPFFCESCDREHLERMIPHQLSQPPQVPEILCESCGSSMVFDELPESYFSFVGKHASRPVDPEVLEAAESFEAAQLSTKIAELKEVSSSVRGPQSSVSGIKL